MVSVLSLWSLHSECNSGVILFFKKKKLTESSLKCACHSVDWMVTEWWLKCDWKPPFPSSIMCHSATIQLTERWDFILSLTAQWPWVSSKSQILKPFTGNGDVSLWVKNSSVGHKTPNKQKNCSDYLLYVCYCCDHLLFVILTTTNSVSVILVIIYSVSVIVVTTYSVSVIGVITSSLSVIVITTNSVSVILVIIYSVVVIVVTTHSVSVIVVTTYSVSVIVVTT